MLNVVYSNDMVQLASQLSDSQLAQPLPPLEAETIIVQSNELARWLSLFLATQHGVVSHVDFPYPSAYIWTLARNVLPNIPKQSPFSTDSMAWRIFEYLPECRLLTGFEPIDSYLGPQDDVLKRYHLAHRIADTFDQYLMYRPDWILAWEQGEKPHWQAMLWQHLAEGDDAKLHRANLLVTLKDYLNTLTQRPAELPSRIAIFGLSALPPVYMDLFELMSKHCDITLYFLSPSDQYWGDLVDQKTQTKRRLEADNEEDDYFVSGHPLLASLGKQGQDFFEQLQSYHHQQSNLFVAPEADHVLAQLQRDIYSLNELDSAESKTIISEQDDSIMAHSCHSAMREIEVLHDQLLALFERHPELSPTDIVVMTPDIAIYTPWIDAVFSSSNSVHNIPYGIADEGVQKQNPVLTAFIRLLDLPQSRFEVESIIGLLECQAIQQRFSFDEEAVELIRQWLRETNTRWGYSSEDKAELGLPEIEANTWRAGLDRLLLGYAMPLAAEGQEWGLFEGKLAFDGISGDRAEVMAQLCLFIDKLDRIRSRLKAVMTPIQWQRSIINLLDEFFSASDEHDEAELTAIRTTLNKLVESSITAHFEQKITIELVKEWLEGHLDFNQSQTRFMGQGVTFCGMVPMRSIPFEVVCLIGMNDGSYPRRQPVVGFDLLSTTPMRKGDRSRRDDDRYLFLEAILSAKSHLYISYVGASIFDNALIPPSVLISDLRDVLRLAFKSSNSDNDDIWQQVLTEHPLQAFSQRYFNASSTKLFSYVEANLPPERTDDNQIDWLETEFPEADERLKQLTVAQLIQFFKQPARYCLQQRLGLRLDSDSEQLDSREPFELTGLDAWSLRQQLLNHSLDKKQLAEALPTIQATGVLPQGAMGDSVFTKQADKVDQFVEKLLPTLPDEFLKPVKFELQLGEFSLSGFLNTLSPEGGFAYTMGKTKANHLLSSWINHLILNCIKPKGASLDSRLITEDGDYQFNPVAEPEAVLQELLSFYWQGLHRALPLLPNTSFAYAKASLNNKNTDTAMQSAWQGSQFSQAEKDDLYYQQLYGNTSPLNDEFEQIALAIYTPLHQHVEGGL